MEFRWRDTFGLEGKEPFTLAITGRDDEAPSLACENLPRQKVVLDSEQLSFKVHAQDDFGVRRVGMEWQGMDDPGISKPAKGERILGAGGQDRESLELAGTFSAKSLGIEPQPVQVADVRRGLPPRPAAGVLAALHVLRAHPRAACDLDHRTAQPVAPPGDRGQGPRDAVVETNKELRALAAADLDKPENRRGSRTRRSAERSNGRRLSGLVSSGEDLSSRRCETPSSASATWRSGPRCSRS